MITEQSANQSSHSCDAMLALLADLLVEDARKEAEKQADNIQVIYYESRT